MLTEGVFRRRSVGGAGTAAPADVLRKHVSGRRRVTVRPNYVGLPLSGLDADRMKAGESLPDQGAMRVPSGPGRTVPEPKIAAVERRKASRSPDWRARPSQDGRRTR
jgi:hypothetical protein